MRRIVKSSIKVALIVAPPLMLAAVVGTHLGSTSATEFVAPSLPAPGVVTVSAEGKPSQAPTHTENQRRPLVCESFEQAIQQNRTLEELDPLAQELAEQNTPESVQTLLNGIERIKAWPARAALAKNLRAVSNPDCLQTLLPALLNNYGRGNTILNEISDCIARLAQPETVEDLAALHWQASVQAGQGHKVLRTVACIRNPVAMRGLVRLAARDDSPALVAAANEAIKAMQHR